MTKTKFLKSFTAHLLFFVLYSRIKEINSHEASITVPEAVKFYQFYSTSPTDYQEICHDGIENHVKTSKVKFNEPTYIIIDGFLSSLKTNMTQSVKNTILKSRPHSNVIAVDWSELSGHITLELTEETNYADVMLIYQVVKTKVEFVGKKVAKLIDGLIATNKTEILKIHMIGYSLGAHIAGIAGRIILKTYKERIPRITGLDPAGQGFPIKNLANRLDSTDAEFVDVYHTNRLLAGDQTHEVGHVDVYVNGGRKQPGCESESLMNSTLCNHSFSWKIWNECVKVPCMACLCHSEACEEETGECNEAKAKVGMNISLDIKGEYYLVADRIKN